MSIEVRIATLGDVQNLTKRETEHSDIPREYCRNRMRYSIQNGFITLAEELAEDSAKDSKIVGKLIFQAKENPIHGVGEFEAFEVSKGYQMRGVGSKLVDRSIKEAEKYFQRHDIKMRWLFLFTRSNNKDAKKIYKKFGFKEGSSLGKMFYSDQPSEKYIYRKFP